MSRTVTGPNDQRTEHGRTLSELLDPNVQRPRRTVEKGISRGPDRGSVRPDVAQQPDELRRGVYIVSLRTYGVQGDRSVTDDS